MEKVIKTWGWEHWFTNNNKYCGKYGTYYQMTHKEFLGGFKCLI